METQTLTRRGVLTAAGAAGFAAAASALAPESAKPRRVRFGVRSQFPKGLSLRERALLAQRLGYDGIELGPEWLNQSAAEILRQLEGTAVSAIVGSLQLLNPDPQKRAEAVELDRQRLRMAHELGADCVIEVPVFGPEQFTDITPVMTPREVEDRLLVAGLKQLAAEVRTTGVTLLLEPCARRWTPYLYLQSHAAELVRAVGQPGFGILSDFYHMQLEERDIAATLAETGRYTGYVHLADAEKRTEPGSLPFDYRPGFHALKKWGFAGWLTMEFEATDDFEARLGRALAYIQRQWAEA